MTKEELQAALDIYDKIQRLRESLSNIEHSLGKSPEVRVQGGVGVSAGQQAAEKAEEITELEKQLEIERVVIQRFIDKCSFSDVERKIMILRYVTCLPFKLIQKRIGYERTRTFDYHKNALEKCGLHRTSSDSTLACQ